MPITVERSKVSDKYQKAEFVGYFKLLRGHHSEGGVRYFKGDIIHSKVDLGNQNQLPDSIKFLKVDGPGDTSTLPAGHPSNPGDPNNPIGVKKIGNAPPLGFNKEELSEMTKDDLMSLAHEEGLVFDAKMKKEDMISSLLGDGGKV